MENSVANGTPATPAGEIARRLMERARAAKSPEDIFVLAEACHLGFTIEDAKRCFLRPFCSGALPDQALDDVTGGYMEEERTPFPSYPKPRQEVSPFYSCMEWAAALSTGPFLCATCDYCTPCGSSCVCGYGLPSAPSPQPSF